MIRIEVFLICVFNFFGLEKQNIAFLNYPFLITLMKCPRKGLKPWAEDEMNDRYHRNVYQSAALGSKGRHL